LIILFVRLADKCCQNTFPVSLESSLKDLTDNQLEIAGEARVARRSLETVAIRTESDGKLACWSLWNVLTR
jgi:hypothetical protein